MFKGVFNEDGNAHRLYRHFFTDAISESIASGGGLEFPRFCNNNSLSRTRRLLPFRPFGWREEYRQVNAWYKLPRFQSVSILEWEDLLGLLRDELQEYGVGGLLNAQQQSILVVARTACLRSISPFRRKWRQVKCCRGASGLRLIPCVFLRGAGRINA